MTNINTIYTRAAAEGYSLSSLKKAMQKVRNSMKTGGISRPGTLLSHHKLAGLIGGNVTYHGYDSGVGSTASLNGMPLEAYHIHDYHQGQRFDAEKTPGQLARLLETAPHGSQLIWTYDGGCWKEISKYRKSGGVWIHYEEWKSEEQGREEWPNWMPSGIREATAKALGVGLSITFHRLFDQAVEELTA